MKKSQIKVFDELLQDSNFKGKKQLRHLLWLNTTEPKFKQGDKVYCTDTSTSIFGNKVVNFIGFIRKPYAIQNSNEWFYEIDVPVKCGDKEYNGFIVSTEHELKICKAKKDVNVVNKKDKYAVTTSIR